MNQLPNQTPDPFNGNQTPNPLNGNRVSRRFDPQQPDINELLDPPEEMPRTYHPDTVKVLRRMFIILTVTGVLIGGVLSIGILSLMQRAGLTNVPSKVEPAK